MPTKSVVCAGNLLRMPIAVGVRDEGREMVVLSPPGFPTSLGATALRKKIQNQLVHM